MVENERSQNAEGERLVVVGTRVLSLSKAEEEEGGNTSRDFFSMSFPFETQLKKGPDKTTATTTKGRGKKRRAHQLCIMGRRKRRTTTRKKETQVLRRHRAAVESSSSFSSSREKRQGNAFPRVLRVNERPRLCAMFLSCFILCKS